MTRVTNWEKVRPVELRTLRDSELAPSGASALPDTSPKPRVKHDAPRATHLAVEYPRALPEVAPTLCTVCLTEGHALIGGLCPKCCIAKAATPTVARPIIAPNNRDIVRGTGAPIVAPKPVPLTRAGLAGMTRREVAEYSRAELLALAGQLMAREEEWRAAKDATRAEREARLESKRGTREDTRAHKVAPVLEAARLKPLDMLHPAGRATEALMSPDLRDHRHVASSVTEVKVDVIGADGKPTGERKVVEQIVRQSVPRDHKITRDTWQAGPLTPKVYKDLPRFSS